MSASNANGKRVYLECEDESHSPLPMKKQKHQIIQAKIRNIKLPFNLEKLQLNKEYSKLAADDALFINSESTKQSQHIRWVLACKFIIASNLRLDSYDVLGMHRNKIPKNMYFYVDDVKNLCALIHDHQNTPNPLSKNIIEHCSKIATSVIQTYTDYNGQYVEHIVGTKEDKMEQEEDDNDDDEDEDDDLKVNDIDDIIHIIRIPFVYYRYNMYSSFYSLCCRIAKDISMRNDFGNPLFQLLFRNIANFDCFQMSLPMVPLSGDLYQMFVQYGLGVYQHEKAKNSMNPKEFTAFLGVYDCWKLIEKKRKCRKSMHECWTQITSIDINTMKIVMEFADFNQMSDNRILGHIEQFNADCIEYKAYFNELQIKIPELETIVNPQQNNNSIKFSLF